jgi:hypothetical protein
MDIKPTVTTIDEKAIIADLKKSGKHEAVHLIKHLRELLERQQRITGEAIKKLREQSKPA